MSSHYCYLDDWYFLAVSLGLWLQPVNRKPSLCFAGRDLLVDRTSTRVLKTLKSLLSVVLYDGVNSTRLRRSGENIHLYIQIFDGFLNVPFTREG